ncbi:MAG TPA: hypothetical protein VLG49_01490 [Rhabdochlamydiaceae bacterium]|nr:hypothetical protein [Rhabdochlamydiaceae bacterium]
MTLALNDITGRLTSYENRIRHFEQIANEISSAPYSDEKIGRTRSEYDHFHTEIVNFEKDVQHIAEKLITPFKEAMLSQCSYLKEDWKRLGETLERSYLTNEMSDTLDSLFKKCLFFGTSKDRSNLCHMDQLREKHLTIVQISYPILTPPQLQMSMDLQNTIQQHLEFGVGEMLREVKALIAKTSDSSNYDRQQCINSIGNILNKDLLGSELGLVVRKNIYEKLWVAAGSPQHYNTSFSWGSSFFPLHLPALDKIISTHPLFKNESIAEIVDAIESSSEEEGYSSDSESSLANDSDGEIIGSDLSDPEYETEAPTENKEVPTELSIPELDLSTLKPLILRILSHGSLGNMSNEMRTALINKARYRLPEKMRWALDGTFYELSQDPNKGGEAWGDKHAAEDPQLLLQAIEVEIKKQSTSSPLENL